MGLTGLRLHTGLVPGPEGPKQVAPVPKQEKQDVDCHAVVTLPLLDVSKKAGTVNLDIKENQDVESVDIKAPDQDLNFAPTIIKKIAAEDKPLKDPKPKIPRPRS